MSLGDPGVLAWTFSLEPDPGTSEAVGRELSASWGSFALVAGSQPFCSTVQHGERLDATHWHLLPIVEWLVDNWLAIFHESRQPQPGESAALAYGAALAQLDSLRPESARWGFPAADEEGLAEQTQAWRMRHNLAAAAPQAPLPNLWLRRLDESLELSTGQGRALFEPDVRWLTVGTKVEVNVETAAVTTERALRILLVELTNRFPDGRAARAAEKLDRVTGPGSQDERLAWLIGLQGDEDGLGELERAIDAAFGDGPERQGVMTANPVSMLFGSLAPTVHQTDLETLLGALRRAEPAPGLLAALDRLSMVAPLEEVSGLTDGPAGSQLGDRLAEMLRQADGMVSPEAWLEKHGVVIQLTTLSDPELRAVTLLHGDGRAVVVVNTAYARGSAPHVVRFTLAHELAHLVYDRLAGRTLAQASGPWTPPGRERRANAVAAALLMPEADLRRAWASQTDPDSPESVRALAGQLGVGVISLARRLANIGLLDEGRAEAVLDELATR